MTTIRTKSYLSQKCAWVTLIINIYRICKESNSVKKGTGCGKEQKSVNMRERNKTLKK